ncbi:PEP-CTERM sorting domain-containing protein [Emcibacter sp.]|uniref:PEP-CTERM sorting domain-containing protein n=1 Tax=Emcibacter sp. TaxID=1979954 RepID=UPI003A91D8B1
MAKLFNTMIKAAALAALMALGATASQAAIISISGSCVSNCSNVGATDGDPYSGEIELVDAAVAPGASFDNDDVLGFSFEVGDVSINEASAAAYVIAGTFNDTLTGLVDLFVIVTEALLDETGEMMILVADETAFYSASLDGYCVDETCEDGDEGTTADLSEPEVTVTTAVSEPAMLGLLGLGLVGFGLARRRG